MRSLSRSELLLALLLLSIGALAFWFQRPVDEAGPRGSKPERRPDYVVEGVRGVTLDEMGRPDKRLEAARLLHYPDDGSSELEAPRLWVYSEEGPPWQARARLAWINERADEVLLQQDVILSRAATAEAAEIELRSSELLLLPEQDYAETSHPVEIKQADDWLTGDDGMRAWLGDAVRVQVLGRAHAELNPLGAADPS